MIRSTHLSIWLGWIRKNLLSAWTVVAMLSLGPTVAHGFGRCEPGAPCDDGVDCTVDLCIDGACVGTPVDGLCDNDLFCDGQEVCDFKAGCQSGEPPCIGTCDEVADICHLGEPVSTVVVKNTAPAAAAAGLITYDLHVQFNGPQSNLYSVGFVQLETDDPDGFFQSPFGSYTPPNNVLCAFPGLELICSDSYVTIGCEDAPCGGAIAVCADFDQSQFNSGGLLIGGWFNTNPANGLGFPDANLRVLIAQLTVHQGFHVSGPLSVWVNDGTTQYQLFVDSACPTDLNDDGVVNAFDLALLLGAWGPNLGHAADQNADGVVNASDLALLLGSQGPC